MLNRIPQTAKHHVMEIITHRFFCFWISSITYFVLTDAATGAVHPFPENETRLSSEELTKTFWRADH